MTREQVHIQWIIRWHQEVVRRWGNPDPLRQVILRQGGTAPG